MNAMEAGGQGQGQGQARVVSASKLKTSMTEDLHEISESPKKHSISHFANRSVSRKRSSERFGRLEEELSEKVENDMRIKEQLHRKKHSHHSSFYSHDIVNGAQTKRPQARHHRLHRGPA